MMQVFAWLHACFALQYQFVIKESFYRLHEEKNWREDTFWRNEQLLSLEKDQERKHLNKLYRLKSIGPDEIYPQMQRELANIIARPLSYLWKAVVTESGSWGLEEGAFDELQASQPHLDPWEGEEAYYPGNHFQDWKWLEAVSMDFWRGNPAWQTW